MRQQLFWFIAGAIAVTILFELKTLICPSKDTIIRTLLRQTGRWITASKNDNNVFIRWLHYSYGVGYWYALNDIASSEDIERVLMLDAGISYSNLAQYIRNFQDNTSRELLTQCPNIAPELDLLTKLSGIAGEHA